MKIKALKDYRWKTDDEFTYVEGEIYDEEELRASEMIEHGYACEETAYHEVKVEKEEEKTEESIEEKMQLPEEKEIKAIFSKENKSGKKNKNKTEDAGE